MKPPTKKWCEEIPTKSLHIVRSWQLSWWINDFSMALKDMHPIDLLSRAIKTNMIKNALNHDLSHLVLVSVYWVYMFSQLE